MILYHGTNQDIESIDLKLGHRFKDFGQGFYLTPDRATAERMAKKKAKFYGGQPTVISYEFHSENITEEFKIKEFPQKATAEWFCFIDKNRDRSTSGKPHGYDIVIGPIADDGVVLQLNNFHNNILSKEEAARNLQDKYLDQQYYFGTEKAITLLEKIEVCQIS